MNKRLASIFILLTVVIAVTLILNSQASYVAQADASGTWGDWKYTGSMSTTRRLGGIALLRNGNVLVTGGVNGYSTGGMISSSELYLPSTGTWNSTGNLKTPRFWFGNLVTLNNGKVLVATGTGDPGYNEYLSAELYDPALGTWDYTGNVQVARRNPSLTLLTDGQVLLTGGRQGPPYPCSGFLDSSEIYSPTIGSWSYTTGSLHASREAHDSVLLLNGKVLIAGGAGPCGVHYNYGEVFDPSTGLWTTTGTMSVGSLYGSMTLLSNGKVLRAGGEISSGIYTSLAELYDPATNSWSLTGSMKTARWEHTGILLDDGRVLVAGGHDGTNELASSEIYDPRNGTWTLDSDLNQKRRMHLTIGLSSGRVLVVGGDASFNALSSSELYFPRRYYFPIIGKTN